MKDESQPHRPSFARLIPPGRPPGKADSVMYSTYFLGLRQQTQKRR